MSVYSFQPVGFTNLSFWIVSALLNITSDQHFTEDYYHVALAVGKLMASGYQTPGTLLTTIIFVQRFLAQCPWATPINIKELGYANYMVELIEMLFIVAVEAEGTVIPLIEKLNLVQLMSIPEFEEFRHFCVFYTTSPSDDSTAIGGEEWRECLRLLRSTTRLALPVRDAATEAAIEQLLYAAEFGSLSNDSVSSSPSSRDSPFEFSTPPPVHFTNPFLPNLEYNRSQDPINKSRNITPPVPHAANFTLDSDLDHGHDPAVLTESIVDWNPAYDPIFKLTRTSQSSYVAPGADVGFSSSWAWSPATWPNEGDSGSSDWDEPERVLYQPTPRSVIHVDMMHHL